MKSCPQNTNIKLPLIKAFMSILASILVDGAGRGFGHLNPIVHCLEKTCQYLSEVKDDFTFDKNSNNETKQIVLDNILQANLTNPKQQGSYPPLLPFPRLGQSNFFSTESILAESSRIFTKFSGNLFYPKKLFYLKKKFDLKRKKYPPPQKKLIFCLKNK